MFKLIITNHWNSRNSYNIEMGTNETPELKEVIDVIVFCVQIKGSGVCCVKDAKMCGCGAHSASPACCVILVEAPDDSETTDEVTPR